MNNPKGGLPALHHEALLPAGLRRLGTAAGLKRRLFRRLTPLIRGYIRYVPIAAGKRSFWTRVCDPYFAWEPRSFVATTAFGARLAGNTADILQQYIYYFGVWEPHITRWISGRLAPGDTFVDVGANIGYYSLLTSKLVGDTGSVISIEASPKTFSALQYNLERNRARNVRAVNIAVSDSPGTARLFNGPESNIGQTAILERPGFEYDCEIATAPLSALLRPEEIENCRLIKIDVEGAEWRVAAGMGSLLNSGRRDLEIVIEVTPQLLALGGKRAENVVRIFADAGFHPYALENDYSAVSYLSPPEHRAPKRIRTPAECWGDIVFSRQDSASL